MPSKRKPSTLLSIPRATVKSRFVEMTSGALATIEHRKLEELVTVRLGLTHTPLYTDSGKPFLSIKDISGGSIRFENCKFISEEEFRSLPIGAKPSVGDLLFCRVGTMGKPVIIEEGTPEFGTFVSLGHFKIGPEVNAHFLKAWMESESFNVQVQKHVAGASQPNLNTGWLKQFMVPLPPLALQQEFADFDAQVDKLRF
ncbi:MAG: restriction endonuclease subunit S, partial [Senegalimassilia anaerobia]